MNDKNYIKWIRSKVGHERIMLVHAGGCIFNDDGEILLQRRGDNNKWGLPGGTIELDETPQMAAIREVKEETGLDVEVGELIGIYTDFEVECPNGDKFQSIMMAYYLSVAGGELICDTEETLELKYFPLNSVPPLCCKQHQEIIADIKQGKAF